MEIPYPSAPIPAGIAAPTRGSPPAVPVSLSLIPSSGGPWNGDGHPSLAFPSLPGPAPSGGGSVTAEPGGNGGISAPPWQRIPARCREPGAAAWRGLRRLPGQAWLLREKADRSGESCSHSRPAVPGRWAAGRLLRGSFPTPGMCLLGSLAGSQQLGAAEGAPGYGAGMWHLERDTGPGCGTWSQSHTPGFGVQPGCPQVEVPDVPTGSQSRTGGGGGSSVPGAPAHPKSMMVLAPGRGAPAPAAPGMGDLG